MFKEDKEIVIGNPFFAKTLEVFKTLEAEKKLGFLNGGEVNIFLANGKPLFHLDQQGIAVSSIKLPETFFSEPSPLPDSFVSQTSLQSFIQSLGEVKLDHLGFTYRGNSMEDEKRRLASDVQRSELKLYEEPSNDYSLWLFAGDTADKKDPLVEFCPVVDTSDRWVDYWLPNFQISIDTGFKGEELEDFIKQAFSGKVFPHRSVVVDDTIYVVKARLGIASGININLDLGTESRYPVIWREKVLREVK